MKVSVVNSAGDSFCWDHATDPFYGNYASDNVCCIFSGFEAVLSVTCMLVDPYVTIMQVNVSVAIMKLEVRSFCSLYAGNSFYNKYVDDNFYCNYADGSVCYNCEGGIFCNVSCT